MGNTCKIEDAYTTKICVPYKIAYTRSFDRCKDDIEDMGDIYKKVRHNDSVKR